MANIEELEKDQAIRYIVQSIQTPMIILSPQRRANIFRLIEKHSIDLVELIRWVQQDVSFL